MAYKMPLFTALYVGQAKPFLRQTHYWVLVNQEQGSLLGVEDFLFIFSTEQKAWDLASLKNSDHEPAVLFWEELSDLFKRVYSRALVDNTGQGVEQLVFLDLCEDFEEEVDYCAYYE